MDLLRSAEEPSGRTIQETIDLRVQTLFLLVKYGEPVEDTGTLHLSAEDVLLGCLPHTIAGLRSLLELQQQLLVSLHDLNAFVDEMQIEIGLLEPGD